MSGRLACCLPACMPSFCGLRLAMGRLTTACDDFPPAAQHYICISSLHLTLQMLAADVREEHSTVKKCHLGQFKEAALCLAWAYVQPMYLQQ